jgi:hyaluronan synthase
MCEIPSAWLRSRAKAAILPVVFLVGVGWIAHHVYESYLAVADGGHKFAFLWTLTFLWVLWHVVLSWSERPTTATVEQQAELNRLRVTINVPVYNEDPRALRTALESILGQTRPVQRVQVVNDGSTERIEELRGVRDWWLSAAQPNGPQLEWVDVPNAGKRNAQVTTFRDDDAADVFATVDSDTVLDSRCIEEGLKPFARPDVTAVASMVLAYNIGSWFVRLTDTWLLSFQLTVRGAMSKLGCVLVNCGACSLYRADVVRAGLAVYADERFRGRPVQFSDDSMLTLQAQLKGRTVQQLSSFAFVIWPSNTSHHIRQQLRWMRGSTIRSMWRFRYLPVRSVAYWEHLLAWVNFIVVLLGFVFVFVVGPVADDEQIPVSVVFFALLVCYTMGLRYLTVGRSDRSFGFQLRTFLLAPLMLIWTALVLRPLRLYAMATCYRTGWGTRSTVEVEI